MGDIAPHILNYTKPMLFSPENFEHVSGVDERLLPGFFHIGDRYTGAFVYVLVDQIGGDTELAIVTVCQKTHRFVWMCGGPMREERGREGSAWQPR
jgi:hypothetical protein